ncbi:MAG: hypothetical protein KC729_21025, partial [Candidatus Eisenbacteria bacterium]|nr:hypothetical protein [Candidatus Eisenbacteria bacterium]
SGGPDIWQARMHSDGTFGAVERIAPDGVEDQYKPAVASHGNGSSQVIWSSRQVSAGVLENIEGATLGASGAASAEFLVSMGLGRQSEVRFATDGTDHIAVFESEGDEEARILAQRVDALGNPIESEPVVVGTLPESRFPRPQVAWSGTQYLVTWTFGGAVYGRRLEADLTFVDPAPVQLFSDTAGETGVAALGSDFFVAYPHTFSGDQRSLKGAVISGSDLSVIGSLMTIGGGFAIRPVARTIGDRVLVFWEKQVNHDNDASTISAVWIEPDGTVGPSMVVSQSGDSDHPDVAVAEDRMLVTWMDEFSTTDTGVEGRILGLDGSFLTPEFTICNAHKEQMFPACGWSGSFFTVAWSDMRGLGQIDQLRGDVYMTRVDADGTVLDPGGVQVTDGPLPEDLPAVVGCADACIIAFSQLHGTCGSPEVQRIGYVSVRQLGVADVEEGTVGGFAFQTGPNPFQEELRISWQGALRSVGDAGNVEIIGIDGRRIWSAPMTGVDGSVAWNGKTRQGHAAPAGAYFVRMRLGADEVGTARVLRVR